MELSNEAIVSLAVVFTYIILSAVLLRWGGKLYKRSHTSTQIFTTRLVSFHSGSARLVIESAKRLTHSPSNFASLGADCTPRFEE